MVAGGFRLKSGARCTLKKRSGCWGITLHDFKYTNKLGSISKGRIAEWTIYVNAHSKATKGFQCIRYFFVENLFTMV